MTVEPTGIAVDRDTEQALRAMAGKRGISVAQLAREMVARSSSAPSPAGSVTPARPAPSGALDLNEMIRSHVEQQMSVQLLSALGGGFGGAPKEEDPIDKYVGLATKLTLVRNLPKMLGGGDDSEIGKSLQSAVDARVKEITDELKGARSDAAKTGTDLEAYKKEVEKREHDRQIKDIEAQAATERERWKEERDELRGELSDIRTEMRDQPKPPSELELMDKATNTFVTMEEKRVALRRALTGMAGFAREQEAKGNKSTAEEVKEWIELVSEGAAAATDLAGRAQGLRGKGGAPATPAQGTPPGPNYPPVPPSQSTPPGSALPPAGTDEQMFVESGTGRVLSLSQWRAVYGADPIIMPPPETTSAPAPPPAPAAAPPPPPPAPAEPSREPEAPPVAETPKKAEPTEPEAPPAESP
ncbi:MAG: hypothetical protein ACREC5_01800 [Thermoplasmata archaeon]